MGGKDGSKKEEMVKETHFWEPMKRQLARVEV